MVGECQWTSSASITYRRVSGPARPGDGCGMETIASEKVPRPTLHRARALRREERRGGGVVTSHWRLLDGVIYKRAIFRK